MPLANKSINFNCSEVVNVCLFEQETMPNIVKYLQIAAVGGNLTSFIKSIMTRAPYVYMYMQQRNSKISSAVNELRFSRITDVVLNS